MSNLIQIMKYTWLMNGAKYPMSPIVSVYTKPPDVTPSNSCILPGKSLPPTGTGIT